MPFTVWSPSVFLEDDEPEEYSSTEILEMDIYMKFRFELLQERISVRVTSENPEGHRLIVLRSQTEQYGLTVNPDMEYEQIISAVAKGIKHLSRKQKTPKKMKEQKLENSMKTIRQQLEKTIASVINSKRVCMNDTTMVPTEKTIYSFRMEKNQPRNNYLICPEDLFEIKGNLRIESSCFDEDVENLWELGDPTATSFALDGNEMKIFSPEELITTEMKYVIEDAAGLIKKALKKKVLVQVNDEEKTQAAYKAKRKEIKNEIKESQPELEPHIIKERVEEIIREWNGTIYKTIMEV
jgi:hypothetical protein